MKHLIIGIDGGDLRILKNLDLPFCRQLIHQSNKADLKEDVWSRGWAEMYTGKHARDTKAFYEMPVFDGTCRMTRKFSWKEATENPEVEFLWDAVDKQEIRSLFMNIPTTYPAPQLNSGVFISGAGGGLNNLSSIPDGLCSNEESRALLEDRGYIVDLRYKPSGITELKKLFEQLNYMCKKRAECFVDLCQHYNTEFGFLAFRATTIVQYVAMCEIELLIGGQSMEQLGIANGDSKRPIHTLIQEHYHVLDNALRHIFESLEPENFIVTADHGCVPFLKRANMNPFLVQNGYQRGATTGHRLKRLLVKTMPFPLFNALRSAAPISLKRASRGYNTKSTKATAHENIHGIYINDQRRFGGPVKEGAELDQLVDQIVREFNDSPLAMDNGLSTQPYRRLYPNAYFQDYLPDISLDRPESIFFCGFGPFVEANETYRPILDLSDVPTDVNSGQKGTKPLFLTNLPTENLSSPEKPRDLTVVYEMTRAILNA